ncbi:MAG: lactonase family protein [Chloroflexi bacterium]|nr:lactonase family protein [Chloroflexota bacterium]
MNARSAEARFLYVGTFTGVDDHGGGAEGIYVCRMNMTTGAVELVHTVPDVPNPSYLALHPELPVLYAVNAVPEIDGHAGGAVSTFAVDHATGGLEFINRQSSQGAGPCHVSVEQTGKYVITANYTGGSVAILPITEDWRLGPATDWVQHVGSSVNPDRQGEPHGHSFTPDPANRFALACDLGLDQVLVYGLDLENGKLPPADPPFATVHAGAGPRHLDFHPNGRTVYVINEIGNTMTVFAYDQVRGAMNELQTIPTLPPDFEPTSHTADVHVHPNGKFVYGSNRGHDSIVIYGVNDADGTLTLIGHQSTLGEVPRNFVIDPTGTFLLAANQDTDSIVTFRIDAESGELKPTGHVASVPTPVCLKFATP